MAQTTCCRVFELKTGGQILGWLNLIYCFFLYIVNNRHIFGFAYSVLLTAIYGAWLYGIKEKKLEYMLPCVIWAIFTTALLAIVVIVAFLTAAWGITAFDLIIQIGGGHSDKVFTGFFPIFDGIVGGLWLILAIILALNSYCTWVIWSLYKQMKEEVEQHSSAQPCISQPSFIQQSFIQQSFAQPSAPIYLEGVHVVNQLLTK